MIGCLAAALPRDWEPLKASRQKKDALFDLAVRVALLAERSRSSGVVSLSEAAKIERRKALRAGLRVIADGGDGEELDRALAAASTVADPGAVLESRLVRSGLRGLLAGEHPYTLMRRMCAHLGVDYFDRAGVWILSRLKHRPAWPGSLLVPGELPDVVRDLALDPRALERALRAAGREIAAAALAGCPQESMDLATPLYGHIGGAVIEDDAAFLRSRLSGDDIAQAQSAFLEIARALEERGELDLAEEDELEADPVFVAEFTKAVMGLDASLLKAAFRAAESRAVAAAMQSLEPRAHNRILASLSKKDVKRILDAIDEAPPLRRRAITEAGSRLAKLILDTAERRGPVFHPKSGAQRAALQRLERIRDWNPAAE
jgi:hypothetical protein